MQKTYRVVGDPTEGALLVAAAKAGGYLMDITQAYPRENEIPFDSDRKRMVTIHTVLNPRPEDFSPFSDRRARNWDVIVVKGAPDVVLGLCTQYQTIQDESKPLTAGKRREIIAANDGMTERALRVLGLAYRTERDVPAEPPDLKTESLERELVFIGLIGMIDPPREEVKPALQKTFGASIRTLLITGDYPNTAPATAESI